VGKKPVPETQPRSSEVSEGEAAPEPLGSLYLAGRIINALPVAVMAVLINPRRHLDETNHDRDGQSGAAASLMSGLRQPKWDTRDGGESSRPPYEDGLRDACTVRNVASGGKATSGGPKLGGAAVDRT
jgi:hypothetical protein